MLFLNGHEVEFYESKNYEDRSFFDSETQYRAALRHATAPKTLARRQGVERRRWVRERVRAEHDLLKALRPLLGRGEAAAARNRGDSWLERWATAAYQAGREAAGVGDIPMGDADDRWLRTQYIKTERGYLRKLIKGLADGRVSEAQLRYRVRLYAQSLDSCFYVGLVSSFPQTSATKIRWVLGVTEHCAPCVRFSRKAWTARTLVTTPRAGATPCKANCHCTLEVWYDAAVRLAARPTRGRGERVTAESLTKEFLLEVDDTLLLVTGIEATSPVGMLVTGNPTDES